MVRRSTDREPDLDLVALDPVTGATIDADGGVAAAEPPGGDRRATRARRLHRLAVVLAGASLAAALMAAWFGLSIRNLRSIERTWRAALAVDAAREEADRSIRRLVPGDSEAIRQPLDDVGDEEAARLLAMERDLDHERILDPKVSKLRDEMIGALRFRRFQMTPERLRLGRTPIDRVEVIVGDQLRRWGMKPSVVEPPRLRTLDDALDGLRRYSSQPTRTLLAATTDAGAVFEVDVDASATRDVAYGVDGSATVVATTPGGGVAVLEPGDPFAGRSELHVLDRDGTVRSTVDLGGGDFVPGGRADDGAATGWIAKFGESGGVRRVVMRSPTDVTVDASQALPRGAFVVGGSAAAVFISDDLRPGSLRRFDPATGAETLLASSRARFLAANEDIVLWQGPLNYSDSGNGGFLHLLHLDTGERDLIGLTRTDAASAVISPDGRTIAIAAGPLAGRLGSVLLLEVGTTGLVGAHGPRVAVDGPAMTWSPDSRTLFWRTPDGELAVRHSGGRDDPPQSEVLRTALRDVTAVAALAR